MIWRRSSSIVNRNRKKKLIGFKYFFLMHQDTMSKIICATYIPKQIFFSIPADWNLEDVKVVNGELLYQDGGVDKAILKRAYTFLDDEKYPQKIVLCDAPVKGVCSGKQLHTLQAHFSGEIDLNDSDDEDDEEREAKEREAMQKEDK